MISWMRFSLRILPCGEAIKLLSNPHHSLSATHRRLVRIVQYLMMIRDEQLSLRKLDCLLLVCFISVLSYTAINWRLHFIVIHVKNSAYWKSGIGTLSQPPHIIRNMSEVQWISNRYAVKVYQVDDDIVAVPNFSTNIQPKDLWNKWMNPIKL